MDTINQEKLSAISQGKTNQGTADDLFQQEEVILAEAKRFINSMSQAELSEHEKYVRLYLAFERFVKRARRTMRISDRMTKELNSQKLELTDKAYMDELTGVYNRRYMKMAFDSCLVSSARYGKVVSVIMLDIDYFKKYNDCYGHQAGDVCLKNIALALGYATARSSDVLARYGGEEFIAILPDTDKHGAIIVAEKMLQFVRDAKIPHEKSEVSDWVTVSVGATSATPQAHINAEQYIRAADTALYEAKRKGRNQLVYGDLEDKL